MNGETCENQYCRWGRTDEETEPCDTIEWKPGQSRNRVSRRLSQQYGVETGNENGRSIGRVA